MICDGLQVGAECVVNEIVLLVGIIFLGVFSQSVSGFGLGLITMPILSATFGLATSRPLMSMVGVTMQIVMMIRNRHALSFRTIGVMSLLGFAGIPLGARMAEGGWLPESVLLGGLGVITVTYALYALLSPQLPELRTNRLLGVFALLSGVFSGSYNVGGPPIMIYADARRWTADQIRSNLQGFFMFKAAVLVIWHVREDNITSSVLFNYAWALPAIAVGLLTGFSLYGHIDARRFRQIVQVLLVVVGCNILFRVIRGM
jgi:uncharacterized membrane protein YfcA